MDITPESVIKIASYFSVISHVKGRLRVRVNPEITEKIEGIGLKDINEISHKIRGIKSVKVNKLVASVTILYDANVFSKQTWDDLLEHKNIDEVTKKIQELYEEIK